MSKAPKKQPEKREASDTSQVVARATDATNTNLKGNKMSEDRSIIEYTDSLDHAEAPVPLPAGDYSGEIRGAEVKTSGKNNDYVQVTFFVDADQYPPDYTDGNLDGTTLSFGRLSPDNTTRARYGMRKFAEAIGAPLGKSVDLNSWIGKTAIITVVNTPYEGTMQANIKSVKPA